MVHYDAMNPPNFKPTSNIFPASIVYIIITGVIHYKYKKILVQTYCVRMQNFFNAMCLNRKNGNKLQIN